MKPEEGLKIIKEIVNEWSQVYINQVFYVNSLQNVHHFQVEFSRPTKVKPMTEGTVKVEFYVIDKEPESSPTEDSYDVEFNF